MFSVTALERGEFVTELNPRVSLCLKASDSGSSVLILGDVETNKTSSALVLCYQTVYIKIAQCARNFKSTFL